LKHGPHRHQRRAFEAIARTLPLGSVGYEAETNERGEREISLEDAMADRRSGVTLDDRTLDRIDDALTAEALIRGSNMPVGRAPRSRLHRCVRCGAPFIANPAARLCSAECRTALSSERRSERRRRSGPSSGTSAGRLCRSDADNAASRSKARPGDRPAGAFNADLRRDRAGRCPECAFDRGQGEGARSGRRRSSRSPARPVTKPSQRHDEVHRPVQLASSSRVSVSLAPGLDRLADSTQRIESVSISAYAIPPQNISLGYTEQIMYKVRDLSL
jgi:hypothetical protein